ncbi:MAG: class I SAM-dependent methyltransferase [Ignavibacteriales bacterium]|nr:class I SAM-dependent methyltransferase [Ignavibacteriales bacterium]MCF8306251.1 class I SAM-dependent methyltransferase [Ignavibacteriales bacterium]MCF8315972.1 class I SAM-dependent methyltransferase [Ignavibacteriales bacterium]MCF8437566.1 class I SAM-dependent methyltransferase [Ignavibacteriales bacterium]
MEKVNCNYCGGDNYSVQYIKDSFQMVKCRLCGLVYVNPRLTTDEIRELYDKSYFHGGGFDKSLEYEHEFERSISKKDLIDWDISVIREKLGKSTEKPSLLDIGCGMGLFVYKANKAGFNASGLELSEYAANFAASKGLKIYNLPFEDLPDDEAQYDVIVMREVIEHLPDPLTTLKKVRNLLKPGGLLFLTTGNYDCPERRLRGSEWFYFMPAGHIYIFSNRTIKKILVKAGFSEQIVTNQGDLLHDFMLRYGILDTSEFYPRTFLKKVIFIKIRLLNHFISSGLRVYAKK